ncbi:MAG: glycoside hydrolase family 3 protein, partial [Candidatus Dormibacteraceae bacterium]
PLLTARIAVAYVRGVQAAGVGATAKHYVANDSETDRRTYDARITEGVLREMYLAPFEACVVEADVAMVMAAYNSVNGFFMTANPMLLRDLLKTEWGFRGAVVSDWSATTTTVTSARAGLDLVMPGPRGPWGEQLVAAVHAGQVAEAEVDDKVSRLLFVARKVGALNGSAKAAAYERPATTLVDANLLRRATAQTFVLLSNPRGLLPLQKVRVASVALIGPNVIDPQTQGGGSVRVLPVSGPGLAEALRQSLDAQVTVNQGCVTSATIAVPAPGTVRDPVSGEPGVRVEVRRADGTVAYDARFPTTAITWWDGLPDAIHQTGVEVIMRTLYRPEADGAYVVGAAGVGLMRLVVDGVPVAETTTAPPRDVVEAFSRPPELRVPLQLKAWRDVDLRIEHRPNARGHQAGFATVRLGITPRLDDDRLMEDAVRAAGAADIAVVVVGSADGAESEGYDRESMALSGRQDELVRRVAAANANTVVVVNSGMPVLMPWADDVAAVMQVWFPGQEFGAALADTLAGEVEPGGRLPVSVPLAEADSPVLDAHPENGDLIYGEGLLVGYRGYDRSGRPTHFCFGHGLGYTDWTYESLLVESVSLEAASDLSLLVTVRNNGARPGQEILQVYLEPPDDDPARPIRTLCAFAAVAAQPGARTRAHLTVGARSFQRFDEAEGKWISRPGTYTLRAGRSVGDLRLSATVELGTSG